MTTDGRLRLFLFWPSILLWIAVSALALAAALACVSYAQEELEFRRAGVVVDARVTGTTEESRQFGSESKSRKRIGPEIDPPAAMTRPYRA